MSSCCMFALLTVWFYVDVCATDSFDLLKKKKKKSSLQTCLWAHQELEWSIHSFKPQSTTSEKPGNCSVLNVFWCYFYSSKSSWSRLQTTTFLLGELTMTHIQARKPGAIEQFQSHAWRLSKNKINQYPPLKVNSQNLL